MARRPPNRTIAINAEEVGRLATLGFGLANIADVIGVSHDTLRRRLKRDPELTEAIRAGGVAVKTRLRAALIRKALDGDARLLMFLAKSELGMSEAPQRIELSGPNGTAIETTSDGISALAQANELLERLTEAARNKPEANDGGDHDVG